MARPRKIVEADAAEPAARKRIVIPIREDGLDFSGVPEEYRDTIRSGMSGPDAEAQPEAPKTDPAVVRTIIGALGKLEAAILSSRYGIDPAKAARVCDPQEPYASMIAESGARICDKYGAFGRWADEIALITALTLWQGSIFMSIQALKPIDVKAEPADPA